MTGRFAGCWLAALALTAGAARADEAFTVALSNGVVLRVDSRIGGPIKAGMIPASGDSFFRYFKDGTGLVVYAYELMVDRPGGGNEFHLVVKPAGTEFAARLPNSDGGKPPPTVSEPRQLANPGSNRPVDFEVFHIAGRDERVVDSISLKVAPGQAGSGQFRFDDLKVYVNRTLTSTGTSGVVAGRYAMFYLPGRGGYFFSSEAVPGSGFVEAGWVDRARMQFTIDNETFDCSSEGPVLTQSERGQLWVFHDPAFKPEGNWTKPLSDPGAADRPPEFYTGAGSTLGWWTAAGRAPQ